MAVALTGHRSIPYDKVPSLRKALRTVILEHYNRGIRIFYCGMAMGFDLLAAETALSMKEVYSDITLVATGKSSVSCPLKPSDSAPLC